MKQNKSLRILAIAVYLIFFVLISLYVFIANDETQPVIEIFHLNFLIPVIAYSTGILALCYVINLFLSQYINKIFSFSSSLLLGIPLGIYIMESFFKMIANNM